MPIGMLRLLYGRGDTKDGLGEHDVLTSIFLFYSTLKKSKFRQTTPSDFESLAILTTS